MYLTSDATGDVTGPGSYLRILGYRHSNGFLFIGFWILVLCAVSGDPRAILIAFAVFGILSLAIYLPSIYGFVQFAALRLFKKRR